MIWTKMPSDCQQAAFFFKSANVRSVFYTTTAIMDTQRLLSERKSNIT